MFRLKCDQHLRPLELADPSGANVERWMAAYLTTITTTTYHTITTIIMIYHDHLEMSSVSVPHFRSSNASCSGQWYHVKDGSLSWRGLSSLTVALSHQESTSNPSRTAASWCFAVVCGVKHQLYSSVFEMTIAQTNITKGFDRMSTWTAASIRESEGHESNSLVGF